MAKVEERSESFKKKRMFAITLESDERKEELRKLLEENNFNYESWEVFTSASNNEQIVDPTLLTVPNHKIFPLLERIEKELGIKAENVLKSELDNILTMLKDEPFDFLKWYGAEQSEEYYKKALKSMEKFIEFKPGLVNRLLEYELWGFF